MTSFSLDTNCIYAIAKDEPDAPAVRALADAHTAGTAQVAIEVISASENQRAGEVLRNFADFEALLSKLRLDHLERLSPLARWGMAFWGSALWSGEDMLALERQIHEVLFPRIEFELPDYCQNRGLSPDPFPREWRNAKCDVLALWSHIYHRREVFVTSDRNFHAPTKKPALIALGAGQICRPTEAIALI
jgi:hypothetical protein